MAYPPLVQLGSEDEYRQQFLMKYCSGANITTRDGILVKFRPRHFKHAFYKAAGRRPGNKSVFSIERAERIDWIEAALADPTAELYIGYDRLRKRPMASRRVSVSNGDYVVVIEVERKGEAVFVTAFRASPQTLGRIRSNPKWPKK